MPELRAPHLMGVPHRSTSLERALVACDQATFLTPCQIADWFVAATAPD